MSLQKTIERKLREALDPSHLEVENESGMHDVPPGAESHFKVTIVSPRFAGRPLVARHRKVYAVLSDELAGPIHALSVHAYTPEEWAARGQTAPASPQCRGGGKVQPP